MNKKFLLGVAILAIGLVVFPQTIAMFAGQHNWYDTTTAGNQIPCAKCHADVFQELSQGPDTSVNGLHRQQVGDTSGCDACHITTAPVAQEKLVQGPGGQFHAAAAPACLDCHSGAGGGGKSALEILTGSEEVHKPFANQSIDSKFLKGANEACISCHTHIMVNITWQKATTIEFNSTETVLPSGNHSWIVGNFTATGVNITKTSGGP